MITNTEQGKRLSGFFRGIVKQHCIFKEQDGKKIKSGNGCCKIWIPGIYPDSFQNNPEMLPDAEQISPLFGGSCKGNGTFSYPNIGSVVICGFFNEDQNKPFFFGSILGGPEAEREYYKIKPNIKNETVETGQDAYIHTFSVDKSRIEMNEGGYINIKAYADREGENHTNISLDGKGNLIIETTQQIFLKSPQINLSAEQSFELTSPQIKINALQSYEINTQTLAENVSSKKGLTTQTFEVIAGDSVVMESKSVLLDASTGSCIIKGKTHTPLLVD